MKTESNEQKTILGIETSCDDTCASVVENGEVVLSNIISSQEKLHEKYGGVVPEVAARSHIEVLPFVVDEALKQSNLQISDIDAVAVTSTPGLMPSLVVGISFAKGLVAMQGIPLIPVNHLEAHIYANHLRRKGNKKVELKYPYLALLVSGGHTQLWLASSPLKYKLVGGTRDDAAGEAFDKVARMLDLGYPGGPEIDKLARDGDEGAIDLPRPMVDSGDYDFSFSGLKTAVSHQIKKYERNESKTHPHASDGKNQYLIKNKDLYKQLDNYWKADMAASFQEAVVDVLVTKASEAAQELGVDTIVVGGGVSANSRLREKLVRNAYELGLDVRFPEMEYCLDNAAMVAGLGFHRLK